MLKCHDLPSLGQGIDVCHVQDQPPKNIPRIQENKKLYITKMIIVKMNNNDKNNNDDNNNNNDDNNENNILYIIMNEC